MYKIFSFVLAQHFYFLFFIFWFSSFLFRHNTLLSSISRCTKCKWLIVWEKMWGGRLGCFHIGIKQKQWFINILNENFSFIFSFNSYLLVVHFFFSLLLLFKSAFFPFFFFLLLSYSKQHTVKQASFWFIYKVEMVDWLRYNADWEDRVFSNCDQIITLSRKNS